MRSLLFNIAEISLTVGIITGASHSGKVVLDPRGIATRAQIATILMRFCEIYGAVGTEK